MIASAPKTINHPSFGPCELVPSIMAIKWASQLNTQSLDSVLSTHSLTRATETPQKEGDTSTSKRDPRAVNINHNAALTWTSGKALSAAALTRLQEDNNVEWVAPVYRAVNAAPGPQSYFTINPTVVILSQSAAAVAGDLKTIDESASIDQNRSKLLKGFVVINLPNGNAIEIAGRLNEAASARGIPNGVKLENIPYISPITGGCSCEDTQNSGRKGDNCSPSISTIIPNDTFYPNQWGLERINAPRAWPLSEGDPNVVIAVLDEGVELAHPDLNLWPVSYSTISHTFDGSPVGNHGTACAGIIASRIGNGAGVAGLAGKCRVMAISTYFADVQIAEGLYFAADNGARVVSMSFGLYPWQMIWDFSIIEAALQYCQEHNVVLVAATGNEDQNVSRFPATDPRTIGIGGSNRDDVRKAIGDTSSESWWGACFGPDVDVVAPCLEIPTTDRLGANGYSPTDYEMTFNGTSSATPHVAALAGLIISVNPALTNLDVRQIISETTDKINTAAYVYTPTAGKPYGTWNDQVGYGRINAERALLVACSSGSDCDDSDACCESPCDPPWRPDDQCIVWYETRFFRVPIGRDNVDNQVALAAAVRQSPYIEFRVTYEHQLCLLGKQHGPLLYTVTLLPGEKVNLYHSDRYRRVTSEEQRYSVQTTFTQFLSVVHQARVTNQLDVLNDILVSGKGSGSSSSGGGFFGGLFGFGGESSASASFSVTDHNMLNVSFVSDQFNQSVVQASQLTHAERSLVVSTYEDRETQDVTVRAIQNSNECHAVTYFVRQVVELYAVSTRVYDIAYHIVATGVPSDWHSVNDLGWLPQQIQDEIKKIEALLPRVGDVTEKAKPISMPTDGAVYDPELAHCGSCDPEREAAIDIQLEKARAEAHKASLEAQMMEVELQRRRLLLQNNVLAPFDSSSGNSSSQG